MSLAANMRPASLAVSKAASPKDFGAVRKLFEEYLGELGEDYDIGGGGLIEEIKALPGYYLEHDNFVLLAWDGDIPAGCLALKRFNEKAGEVKRMYVRSEARGQGIGRKLMKALIERSRALGYQKLYLDSLCRFQPAHRIYLDAGFTFLAEPYDPAATTPLMRERMVFMEKEL